MFALIFGAIGFLDDYEKLRKKQNLGLSAKAKFLLQLVAALAFVFLMRRTGYVTTNLYIPFWNVVKPLPEAGLFHFRRLRHRRHGQLREPDRRRGRPGRRDKHTRLPLLCRA